ncbi:MAG: ABC transporter ATP-binding protein [Lachnospiraceae bacterium]
MSHLLEVKQLTTAFKTENGTSVSVDGIDFEVNEGEIVCIVGESGCGKSVTSLSIMGLLGKDGAVTNGSVLFEGNNLLELSEKEFDKIRGNQISMIFQDPLSSLNPVFTIGYQITESIRIHLHLKKEEAKLLAEELLRKVGLPEPEKMMKKYPHVLSGGMRQRVMIAMAICCNPKLLIADEPTTALDVTIQAQIMNLLRNLQKELKMSIILITHDIGLVAQMADRVFVMYAGQIVEQAPVKELFANPSHFYTKALLDTVPSILGEEKKRLYAIPGMVPEHYNEMTGCRFASRCLSKCEECDKKQLDYEISNKHFVKCIVAKNRKSS